MIQHEREARKKMCPWCMNVLGGSSESYECSGSVCMAWEWVGDNEHGYCNLIEKHEED